MSQEWPTLEAAEYQKMAALLVNAAAKLRNAGDRLVALETAYRAASQERDYWKAAAGRKGFDPGADALGPSPVTGKDGPHES